MHGRELGFAIIVMTLAWWIGAVEDNNLVDAQYFHLLDAVGDVIWVINQLFIVAISRKLSTLVMEEKENDV